MPIQAINNPSDKPHALSLTQSLSQSYRSEGNDSKSLYSGYSVNSKEVENSKPELVDELKYRGGCCYRYFNKISAINAVNLTFNVYDPGSWDEWGIYFCSSRYGRHTKFNAKYFALAAIIVFAQSNFFNLIHLMGENGGAVFLVVLFLTYISFGYLTYLLETLLGQYTGKKPVESIRLMAPALAGLGVALYIRTFYRALTLMGSFSNCLFHWADLLFCSVPESVQLQNIITQERDEKTFIPFCGLNHPYTNAQVQLEFGLDKLLSLLCSLCLFVSFMKLKDIGAGMIVMMRLMLLFLTGYTLNGYLRIHPTIDSGSTKYLESDNSIVFDPFHKTFKTNWLKLLDGRAWARAMIYVMQSLELGTLVHPYLGSKSFFHYRCSRDGFYLILLAFTWNLIGVFGVLLWFGYVGINETEMNAALGEIDGYYGMFVVFPLKHIQAEMTAEVENDVLFFCSIFYFITGIIALLGTTLYIYILTDCSYPESGHAVKKLCILMWYIITFGVILLPLMTSPDGVRHLIFLDYYASHGSIGIFVIFCFIFAVCWSQGMGRVLHDFYNMIHLQGYEVMTHYHQIPTIAVFLFTGYPLFALIMTAISPKRLIQGSTDWKHPVTYVVGWFLALLPVLSIIIGLGHHLRTRKFTMEAPLTPHRDFYKNKHHIFICFKDYTNFDPELLPDYIQRPPELYKRKSDVLTNKRYSATSIFDKTL